MTLYWGEWWRQDEKHDKDIWHLQKNSEKFEFKQVHITVMKLEYGDRPHAGHQALGFHYGWDPITEKDNQNWPRTNDQTRKPCPAYLMERLKNAYKDFAGLMKSEKQKDIQIGLFYIMSFFLSRCDASCLIKSWEC